LRMTSVAQARGSMPCMRQEAKTVLQSLDARPRP
jgi:hypothetical protein